MVADSGRMQRDYSSRDDLYVAELWEVVLMIKQFPTLADRQSIHNIIGHHSQGKCSRNDAMRLVAEIVERYNLTKMNIFDYSVRVFYSKHAPGLPILSIESTQISEDCPVCHSVDSKYLRTEKENLDLDYDIVDVQCLECGAIYGTKGNNGRNGWVSIPAMNEWE